MARSTRKSPAGDATARAADDAAATSVEDAVIVPEAPAGADGAETSDEPAAADPAPLPPDEIAGTATAGPDDAASPETGRSTIGPGTDAPGPDPRMRREARADAEDARDLPGDDPAAADSVRGSAVPVVTKPARPVERRSAGFLPLLLGGLLAGAIGYVAAIWLAPPAAPGADDARIAAVEARLAALPDAPVAGASDLDAVRAAQSGLTGELGVLSERIAALEARTADVAEAATAVEPGDLTGIETRVDALDGRLGTVAGDLETASATADAAAERVGAVEGDVAAQADQIAASKTRMDGLTADLGRRLGDVEAGLGEVRTRASSVEDEAQTLARQSARNQVRLALQSGAAYADPLAVLGEAPADLSGPAASGVAPQAALARDFPDLAREALRASRAAEPEAGVGPLLRSAFGARSLEPRAGSDADAVLSRAEAAMGAGDLDAALAEIDALPAPARAVLADWSARARQRLAATAAAADFLNDG